MVHLLDETIVIVGRWRELRHWFSVCGHDLPNYMMCVWNLTQGVDSKFLN